MPASGYGMCSWCILTYLCTTVFTRTDAHVDDYYLFEEKANSAIPTRVPLSSFTDSSDLIGDLLRDSDDKERGTRAEPTVELASNKSGIRLVFDSNRMLHADPAYNVILI